jgi:hypothetical protein
MKIDIGDIFIVLIFAAIVIGGYLLYKYSKRRDDQFSAQITALENGIKKLDDDFKQNVLLLIGNIHKTYVEVSQFRIDFGLTLNKELANKVQAVLQAGVRPEKMMQIMDKKTGEKKWEKIDEGW